LQIDTDLLRIITNTADELSGGTNIDGLEPQKGGFSKIFTTSRCHTHISRVNCAEITADRSRQRQPA